MPEMNSISNRNVLKYFGLENVHQKLYFWKIKVD